MLLSRQLCFGMNVSEKVKVMRYQEDKDIKRAKERIGWGSRKVSERSEELFGAI